MFETINYDHSKEYEETLVPIINQIKQFCNEKDIPFSFQFAVKNENGKTEYKQEAILPIQKEMLLYDDRLSEVSKVMVGYNPTRDSILLPKIDDSDSL